jgi:hypothetical protein
MRNLLVEYKRNRPSRGLERIVRVLQAGASWVAVLCPVGGTACDFAVRKTAWEAKIGTRVSGEMAVIVHV